VERARKEVEDQLALWEKKKNDYQRRLIQAHLVKGALAASKALGIRRRGGDDREPNQTALAEFERAMKVDSNCTEPIALEFAAHQRVRLGDYAGAFLDFGMLAQWAEAAGKPLVRARALKYQAEIHEWRNGDQPNANAATQLLNTAIQTFPTPLGRPQIIEAAELHETQGRVRPKAKKRNLYWDDSALTSFTDAEGLYRQVDGPVAEAALKRIAKARAAILVRRYATPTGDNPGTPGQNLGLGP
jgi:hypothetical protein